MATGDSNDIFSRLKSVLPSWWGASSPILDGVLSAFSNVAAWAYSLLVYVTLQTRIATTTDNFLDIASYDFFGPRLRRFTGETDAQFSARIRAEVLRPRVSRGAISTALTDLTGKKPIFFEPWNTGDTGGWDGGGFAYAGNNPATGGGGAWDAACGYDLNAWQFDAPRGVAELISGGVGGWGDTNLPGQFFLTVYRPGLQGVPSVSGFDSVGGGWDVGSIEYIDQSMIVGAVTDLDIYATINSTRAAGLIAWTKLQ
jgi:hypothetical protein